MSQTQRTRQPNEKQVKFLVPAHLKRELENLAVARNVALSALLRLIVTEYVRRSS
ncbi:MAG: hypothetical protein IPM16_10485 [Chloroflexi bacterium]|nr:hypothetical protein [Chloroflexota bacterium]